MKIISPKYDVCMKEMFRNKVVLKYFISDILGIPIEQIRSVRLLNTFLARKYRNQKQGILDVLAELNDNTKINIEIQLKAMQYWDKRQVFYLAKMFTSDLRTGEEYYRLKRCICISILDFNFTDREEYHSIYRLRDEKGNVFSDIIEIHTLELGKKLTGKEPVDDWIRLFNVKSEEDLNMIRTKNIGIREAIEEVKHMSLRGILRARYEAHQKAIRDQKAQDAYVRDVAMKEGRKAGLEAGIEEGRAVGRAEGRVEGREEGRAEGIEEGRAEGRAEGLQGLVDLCRSFGLDYKETCKKVRSIKEYEMTSDESIRRCFYNGKSGC